MVLKDKLNCNTNINKIVVVNKRHTCNECFADEKIKISSNKGVGNIFCTSSGLLSQAKWFEKYMVYPRTLLFVSWLLHCIYIINKTLIFIYGMTHKKCHRKYLKDFRYQLDCKNQVRTEVVIRKKPVWMFTGTHCQWVSPDGRGVCAQSLCSVGKRNMFSSLDIDMW